jgi:hypothetical protein
MPSSARVTCPSRNWANEFPVFLTPGNPVIEAPKMNNPAGYDGLSELACDRRPSAVKVTACELLLIETEDDPLYE